MARSAPLPAQSPTSDVGLADTFTFLHLSKRGGNVGECLGQKRQNTHSRGRLGWRTRWPSMESAGMRYEEWRRIKRIWGSLDSGLLHYQQTTDIWRQNLHMTGFWGHRGVSCSVHGFFHTALYQGTDESLPEMSLGDFYWQTKKHPKHKKILLCEMPMLKAGSD